MKLVYKPDFESAVRRWEAFWQGELVDRPPTVITVRREGAPERPANPQVIGLDGDFTSPLDAFEAWAETMYFAGEALPRFVPSFGPDQFAGFLGAEIVTAQASGDTSWVKPCIQDWEDFLPVALDPENHYWRLMLAFYQAIAKRAPGKFLVATLDGQAHVDLLAALRGTERFLLDMVEQPEIVDKAVQQAIRIFPQIFDAVWEAGSMARFGWSSDWSKIVFPARGGMTQSDFSAMISSDMFSRWVLPALETEWEFLDYNFYHLDGPDVLRHLPDLLAQPNLHGIQWVPGGRLETERPQHTWVDIFQAVQEAGKAVQVWGNAEAIKWVHPQLRPELVMYIVEGIQTPTEADELLAWLCANT